MTPSTPYVAVIFTSLRTDADDEGYAAMADAMERLACGQPGYLGIDSARGDDRFGITVSYWASEDAARDWKRVSEHLAAQHAGRDRWYERYDVHIATVTRQYRWERPSTFVHCALPADWDAAQATGEYTMSTRGLTLAEEGFVHCAFDHQVLDVARRYYADLDHLVLLRIDPSRLDADVVVEPPFPGSVEHFPHVYGPITVAAVVDATPWHRVTADWSDPPITSAASPARP